MQQTIVATIFRSKEEAIYVESYTIILLLVN